LNALGPEFKRAWFQPLSLKCDCDISWFIKMLSNGSTCAAPSRPALRAAAAYASDISPRVRAATAATAATVSPVLKKAKEAASGFFDAALPQAAAAAAAVAAAAVTTPGSNKRKKRASADVDEEPAADEQPRPTTAGRLQNTTNKKRKSLGAQAMSFLRAAVGIDVEEEEDEETSDEEVGMSPPFIHAILQSTHGLIDDSQCGPT
jgi:hypothetical protein